MHIFHKHILTAIIYIIFTLFYSIRNFEIIYLRRTFKFHYILQHFALMLKGRDNWMLSYTTYLTLVKKISFFKNSSKITCQNYIIKVDWSYSMSTCVVFCIFSKFWFENAHLTDFAFLNHFFKLWKKMFLRVHRI